MMQTTGERIKEARLAIGISQETLAAEIGKYGRKWPVARTSVCAWEKGTVKCIEAANLLRAALVLGVSPYWLEFGENLGRS